MERWPPLSPVNLEGHKCAIENDVRAPQLAENMDVIVLGSKNIVPTVSSVRIRQDKPYIMMILKNDDKTSRKFMNKATPIYLIYNFEELEGKVGENVEYLLGLDKTDIVATVFNNNIGTFESNNVPRDGISAYNKIGGSSKLLVNKVNNVHNENGETDKNVTVADKTIATDTKTHGAVDAAETSGQFEYIPAAVVTAADRRSALDLKLKDRSDIAEEIKMVLRRHSNVFACFKVIRATKNTRKKGGAGLATNHSHVKQNVTAARGRSC